MKTKSLLLLAVTAIMIIGIFPILNYAEGVPPKDLPDVSVAPWKVKVIVTNELRAEVRPLYTTFGNPADYVTLSGGLYDGVGDLILTRTDFTVRCSGALLTTGSHVLTAAHCVTDDGGDLNLLSGNITFEGDTGDFQIDVLASATKVHPDWDGDVIRGNDVAVLELVSEAPDEITRYDIDRNADDDVNAIGDKAGYGRSGNGNDGDVLPSGTKRDGQNKYDDVADTMLKALRLLPNMHFVPGSVLQYDFDNGLSQNDAFGFFFDNSDLGLDHPEVNSAPGDSGGPTLTSGVITGITSYGLRLSTIFGATSDVDDELNSSFGEFSGDTRVSKYASFIDGVLLIPPPPLTLQAISVTPAGASIPVGSTQQYTATGSFSDGSTADITNQVTWTSSDISVASIDAAGLASAVSEGTTTIRATSGAIVDSTTLTVTTQTSETTPPDTSIDSATDGSGAAVVDGGTTSSTSITFTFSGTDNVAVASFECSFDAAVFSACTSPQSFSDLSVDSHAFQVRAIDTAGNTDPTPASLSWTVVSTALPDIVDITKAQYNTHNGQLRVHATSTDPTAELTIFDITDPTNEKLIGIMKNKGDGTYQFREKGVPDSGEFFTIKVISSNGGFDTAPVIRK